MYKSIEFCYCDMCGCREEVRYIKRGEGKKLPTGWKCSTMNGNFHVCPACYAATAERRDQMGSNAPQFSNEP